MLNKIIDIIILSSLILFIKAEDYKSFTAKLNINLEEVEVVTEDRYVNTIWILTSNDNSNRNGKSVILQHGLIDGGFTWLVLGEDSLAKKLCDEGYIVYIPYLRGTQFSRSHLDYESTLNSDYWNFSFDEMAKYDLPTIINFVKNRDKVEKVYYVGHSQGTLIFFISYMNNPEFLENNIAKFVALGTVPNINNAPHILIKIFQKSRILNLIPIKNFLAFPKEANKVIVPFCTSKAKILCNSILSLAFSGLKETGRIDYERLGKNIFLYDPAGTSLQNMKHWIQIYTAQRLQKYDYGKSKNKKIYGTENPPVYDTTKFKKYSIPSLMTTSDGDPFANPKDTLEFIDIIENKTIVNILSLSNYNHLDYHWSDAAVVEVFPKILNFLDQ